MVKSLVLAAHNWKVLLKSIVYQAILLALIVALGYLIFGGMVDELIAVFNENHLSDFLADTVNSIVNGTFDNEGFAERLAQVIANVRQSVQSVHMPFGGVTFSYILFCLIILVYRMLVSLTDVTAACQLEEFMTSNAERPFSWFFIKKQARSWQFVLIQTAVALPMDLLIIIGCTGFYLLFLVAFRWWAIIPVSIFALLLYTARLTALAYTLPAMACKDCRTGFAFRQGMARGMLRFWQVYWKTLIVVCVMATISILSLLFVRNAIAKTALSTLPNFVLFFYLKCINMVEYFRFDNQPFFYKRVEIEGTDRYIRRHRHDSHAD